ncbi:MULTISPECIES: septum site-determining protein MinC [Pseudoalteromonas]|jgi:septum site-determining protein MinC|uniref:Probable septum site-determining protein MinC n=3 Tax=Pseudoalteromonas TaxID=53246 RepID=A0A0P7E420_9GAMM|nr:MULTISPECIES: septum site-determining protein MinC [Pseudoalteromonas]MDC3188816.1 septum site-determining protein MinC [Pseudoalteromonas elyakovii]MEC8139589.1 septum site-determining protein MinC [Pseudomonadota bacterium]HIM95477.1 septum site-determining protein MinC [Gammaproteobacteria bacterium]KPM74864.1 septum site-determining protein MinC [Pseudoalteromonas sp. UCD-33C]KPM84390.1 septum site-determining protein MinC [Pseudoalteromonas lipolytica]|tara:strand:- start:524 stop:1228 length:705 start_codon:yes stop_codon:yes gene_type:complete
MSEQIFELKGNLFTLSVLHLFSADTALLSKQLDEKIAQAPKFFAGAPIVINLSDVQDEALDFSFLKSMLSGLSLNPVGVCNGSQEQNESAKAAGLSVLNYSQDVKGATAKQQTNTSIVEKTVHLPAQVIHGTVRSGQQVYAKDRDLIVIGAVSHGAEVISDGNVHIYGTLRGRAIAGAKGYNEANIFCQKLEAELVSINGSYWISDSLQGEHWGSAVQIQQKNDSLEISALVKG